MDVHALSNVDDELDVGVVVVVGSTRDLSMSSVHCSAGVQHRPDLLTHLDILVGHPDVVGVGCQILWSGHDGKLNRLFVAKGLVGPFSYRSDLFDRSNTVVGNENL